MIESIIILLKYIDYISICFLSGGTNHIDRLNRFKCQKPLNLRGFFVFAAQGFCSSDPGWFVAAVREMSGVKGGHQRLVLCYDLIQCLFEHSTAGDQRVEHQGAPGGVTVARDGGFYGQLLEALHQLQQP